MELAAGKEELIFPVTTTAESPAGTHKNIFCQVVITENGEPIVHQVGSTELQIDKPLPMPENKPAPAPAAEQAQATPQPAAPEQPPAKPLSRLEKLRLEAKQRAEGGGSE
jgi:hypothetical protein